MIRRSHFGDLARGAREFGFRRGFREQLSGITVYRNGDREHCAHACVEQGCTGCHPNISSKCMLVGAPWDDIYWLWVLFENEFDSNVLNVCIVPTWFWHSLKHDALQ